MSYTPPAVSSIDLSGASSGYSAPPVGSIDLSGSTPPSSDPEGIINSTLDFVASFEGGFVSGQIQASVGFAADFDSVQGAGGSIDAAFGFTGDFAGDTSNVFGTVGASLDIFGSFQGFQDWTEGLDPRQLREFYTLTITGSPDIVFRISSWQATARSGENSNYLQAVIPGASGRLEEIQERAGGELIVSKGYRFSDGSERSEEIVRSDFTSFRYDEGPRQLTATVSGYGPGFVSSQNTRPLKGLRSLNFSDGKFRARCSIDLFLRPGMTVQARNAEFTVDFINYYVSRADKFCEVGQS